MNSIKYMVFLIFILLVLPKISIAEKTECSDLSGPYLGQTAPEKKCAIFLDGIICNFDTAEMCAAFALKGREFYFNKIDNGKWCIFFTHEVSGKWSQPQPINFTEGFTDRDFTISPNGKSIFFGSDRPVNMNNLPKRELDIWYSIRNENGKWDKPLNIGLPVNSNQFGENYPSVSMNGNLYFFSCRNEGIGGCDIYYSVYSDGKYLKPVNLGPMINSEKNDWDSFIAPDESYIIFSSQNRDDTLGGQDLYISFKSNRKWTKAKNMGPAVNSFSGEICPSVTPDGKYLFFTSRRRGKADIFWISAEIIQQLHVSSIE